MRNNVFGAAALAATLLVSGSAFAGDHGPDLQEREKLQNSQNSVSYEYTGSVSNQTRSANFTVVRLDELTQGAAASVKAAATPQAREALQSSINSDAALAAELREQGVQITNIVGSATAFNGRTVFYLR